MAATFDAIGIVVSDLEHSVAFYALLGLEFAGEGGHLETALPGGTRLMLDTEEVVASFDPGFSPPTGQGRVSLAFLCAEPAEVDRIYAEVVAAGHRSVNEPFDAFWGQRYARVLDPDDTVIDLFAPLEVADAQDA